METIKGFKDILEDEAIKQSEVRKTITRTFEKYGFEPAETPVVESEEFVKADSNDETISEIFRLKDRKGRNLALRYEFTFQLKRIAKNKKLPYKRYQIGNVFRDEPITGNRFRQFTQCDADVVGSTFKDEAEILSMTNEIFKNLGIKTKILVNSRKLLNEILDKEGIKSKENVIREIDKLDKLPEKQVKENLKKFKAEKILKILKNKETYFKKFESYKDIEELKKFCKNFGTNIEFVPFLARGLSYYNKNIFEIKSDKIKETICAGGSYLVNGIQSTGISFGLERVSLISQKNLTKPVLIISINQDKEAIKIAKELRSNSINCNLFYGKPGKALEYANSKGIENAILVGEKECKEKKFTLKNLSTGKETKLNLNELTTQLSSSSLSSN